MMNLSYSELREQLIQAAHLLFHAGVMSHSGHGNMSVRLPENGHMLLTSTGHRMAQSIPSHARSSVGTRVPTARADVHAVIHTHSPRVTSFALAHRSLPCTYEAFLRFGITEDIPVAAWTPRGSQESVTNIVGQLQQHPTIPAVLLGNHGLLAFSRDPLSTAQLILIMEEAAGLTLDARTLGGEQPFPAGALERERRHVQQFGSTQ